MRIKENASNDEVIAILAIRDDLTEIEHNLLDRLIRAVDVIRDLETGMAVLRGPAPCEVALQ
jgi:hypothetical protein